MNAFRSLPLLASIVVLGVVPAAPNAHAGATAAQCAARKLDAAGRTLVAEIGCHARALWSGKPVSGVCVGNVDERFETAFASAEKRGGCAFFDDADAIDARLDATIVSLRGTLDAALGRCAATKLRAAARRAFGALACERQARRSGSAVDPRCRARVADQFARAFAKAEHRFTCATSGDGRVVEAMIDELVVNVVGRIEQGPAFNPRPSNLVALVDVNQVQLTWLLPAAASGMTHVRLLRRLNAPPTGPVDPAATELFFGAATATVDPLTALLPDTPETARTYSYAVFGCTGAGVCESTGSRTTLTPTVVQVLRGGGYVLHWRHSAATICLDQTTLGTAATTMSPNWWKSCNAECSTATARQLDATGVADATGIGQAFDALAIPIGRVLSSEFCRNLTTASLMDFGPAIEQRPDITFFVYDEVARCANSYALLAEMPAAGTNTAIIGHAGFTCPVLEALAWSEAAIFKPDGAGGSILVTRVLGNAWTALP